MSQLLVQFHQLYVEAGPGIPASNNRRVCRASFQYALAPGFTFYISSVDYVSLAKTTRGKCLSLTYKQRGQYKLDTKVTAYQSIVHYCGSTLPSNHCTLTYASIVEGQLVQSATRLMLTGPLPAQQHTFHELIQDTPAATCGVRSVLLTESQWRVSNSANSEGIGFIGSAEPVSIAEVLGEEVMTDRFEQSDESLSVVRHFHPPAQTITERLCRHSIFFGTLASSSGAWIRLQNAPRCSPLHP